ncbi:sigma-54 dependent transcriptional regulator [Desulfobacula sp.]|uniref:sigma-54-dependent transcriptional regulator n=1 Tax=Desulfobacula sp. TaxID=2593537 RepID=UPI0026263FA4|nr:sigma-54 dependent transcriptional regulator [Desulfobacula sp.]
MTIDKTVSLLVIDDELQICRNCLKILTRRNYSVEYALDGLTALKLMASKHFDIVITDLNMKRLGGMEVIARINTSFPDTIVIVMTGYANVSSAVEVMKMGAFDYLPKPFTPFELRAVVHQAVARMALRKQQARLIDPRTIKKISHQLIGESPGIKKVIQMVQKVATTDANVLVYGESGTGKELIARAVHANSNRKNNVFFAVDCGTLTGELLSSELFGHVKGAFTGADKDKPGIFKLAHKGTVFLDEISNTSREIQSRLLRFLETREFMPVGSSKTIKVDVRLIFATNRKLEEMVQKGQFREDFYYRIFVYPIVIPTLNERKMDILPIAYFFLNQFSKKTGKNITQFDEKSASRLIEYHWPGNVRQLKNVVERAVILCEHRTITLKELPMLGEISEIDEMIESIPKTNEDLKALKKKIRQKAVNKVERNFILNALARNEWNVTQASKETGLQRTNFQSLMKKHNISRP